MHTAPRPFADAVSFGTLAAEIPLREWRDVVPPRYVQIVRTPEYPAARLDLADAIGTMGYPTVREFLVWRAALYAPFEPLMPADSL